MYLVFRGWGDLEFRVEGLRFEGWGCLYETGRIRRSRSKLLAVRCGGQPEVDFPNRPSV
jgi:hypothetical protein